MASQSVTVRLPTVLYERLKQQAEETDRTIEAELLDVVATALPVKDKLPPELTEVLAPLDLLDDGALWQAARSHLPGEAAEEMEALHRKRQRAGLTPSEAERLTHLVQQYERYMLVRAQAALLLQQRGHNISALGPEA